MECAAEHKVDLLPPPGPTGCAGQAFGHAAKYLHLTHAQLMNFIFGVMPKRLIYPVEMAVREWVVGLRSTIK